MIIAPIGKSTLVRDSILYTPIGQDAVKPAESIRTDLRDPSEQPKRKFKDILKAVREEEETQGSGQNNVNIYAKSYLKTYAGGEFQKQVDVYV